jgi:hypothetical protein
VKLVVYSHKPCWRTGSAYVTDGGFPFQMQALSELFDQTTLVVPCEFEQPSSAATLLTGHNLLVAPLTPPFGKGLWRKAFWPAWLAVNAFTLARTVWQADAIHAPIPGDVGTFGLLAAWLLQKRLFVRHCGNWLLTRTPAEKFWKWFMERWAGGRNLMLATGGSPLPPSTRNPNIAWIFATTLTQAELHTIGRLRQPAPKNPRLVIACRQETGKGVDLVIRSLPIILNQMPEATLDVVGAGSQLSAYRELAAELGLADAIRFHGQVGHTDIIRIFQSADIFCYPTMASEGFPKVVLEALACGLPVVATPVSAIPSLLANGCGRLLTTVTPSALAQAVLDCLADDLTYSRMSALALETAQHYTLERWGEIIQQRLESLWGPLIAVRSET